MDIRIIRCILFFMVLFTTDIYQQGNCQAVTQPTQPPAQQGNGLAVTQPPAQQGNGPAVTQPTQPPAQQGNGPAVTQPTQPPAQQGNGPAVTQSTQPPAQQGNGPAVTQPTQQPAQQGNGPAVTQPTQQPSQVGNDQPTQCVNGSCTAKGDDESCLKNIQGKCPLADSCTKEVKKQNATHSVVTVGCGVCPTKPAITTTLKPPTPAPSTTTLTCCETDLCNRYQAPKSAAFGLRTNIIFYAIGLLALKICI